MEIDRLIREYPNMRGLIEALPPRLLERSHLVRLPAGKTVVLRDDPVELAYFVLAGELIVCNETVDGKFSTWLTMPSPTVISDLEVLSGSSRYAANVSTVTNCTALCLPAADFSALLHQDIDFLWLVASMVTKKNFAISHQRGYAAFRSSLEKTVLFLLQYCSLDPPVPGEDTVVRRTRPAIASEVIISQKTLDRCFMKLREEDYISIVKGKIHVSETQYQRLLNTWDHDESIPLP